MKIRLFICFLLFSCRNNEVMKREFYRSGELKSEFKTVGKMKNGEAKYYYKNGLLKDKVNYKNDILDGDCFSYDKGGHLISRGYFRGGKPVGPIFYYYQNNLILYNERDLKQDVYYVKKFDSSNKQLIKEEGVCLSPNLEVRKISESGYDVTIFYSEPEGYTNEILVMTNDRKQSIEKNRYHFLDLRINKGGKLRIYSELNDNLGRIVCRDSLIKIFN